MPRGRPKRLWVNWKNPEERKAYERKKHQERREAAGLKYYPRRPPEKEKQCRRCKEKLPIERFRPYKGHHAGFFSICSFCENAPRRSHKNKAVTHWGFSKIKRAEMLATQPWCMICLSTTDLKLDHCHTARKPRAVLCNHCNSGLGFFRDDVRLLQNAIAYLEYFKELHHA